MRLNSVAAALLLMVSATAAAENARVLPILSQESGRIEALLLLDAAPTADRRLGLDRVLGGSAPSAEPVIRLARGANSLSASLSLDAQPGLALLCRGNIGLAAALGSLGEQCLLADIGYSDPLLAKRAGNGYSLEGVWSSADSFFDVRFGLAWLDADYTADASILGSAAFDGPVSAGDGALAALGMTGPLSIDAREFSVSGLLRLGEQSWLQIGGARSRTQIAGLAIGVPLRLDTTSLSLDAGYGAFSGRLTGRLIELPSNQLQGLGGLPIGAETAFDVDLGVSWRTPWQARLTVGARNLLGNPDVSNWPLSALPRGGANDGETDTRTPYVRYHQDL